MEKLHKYGYTGPITLELSRKCTLEEILVTKQVIEKVISESGFSWRPEICSYEKKTLTAL
jgi:hypothetical protein